MSNRRSSRSIRHSAAAAAAGGSSSSRVTDDQINDLVSRLNHLLPQITNTTRSDKKSAAKVLQETCNYIRSLHREVDDLSERLSDLLANTDTTQAALIRSLLMQ